MNNADAQNASSTSEITEQHPNVKLNEGNYKRQQDRPIVDAIKGKWKQQVGAARIAWGKLTDDEILKSEGQIQKLTGLIQERYAITREAAHKQVKKFLEKGCC